MEIDVQHRQRAVWPWVIAALLILALVLWWLFGMRDPDATAVVVEPDPTTPAASAALPTAVETYVRFVEGTRAGDAMGTDHEFTANGIRNLTAAVEALAARGGADIQRELTTLRQQADTLEQNPASLRHAEYTRTAFVTLAGLISAMQQARFPTMSGEVASLRDAAERITPDRPLLEQREAVQAFFDQAAGILREASRGTT